MGYMGLSHWADSDNASGFRYRVMDALKQKKGGTTKARKLIRKEMEHLDNRWNTDGFVNVALVMEDVGGSEACDGPTPDIAELMTKRDFQRLITIFNNTLEAVTPDQRQNQDAAWQIRAYERMLKSVKEASKRK